MKRINDYEESKRSVNLYKWYELGYYKFYIRSNIELFSILLLDSAVMLVAYPFLTIKTRI